MTYEGARSSFLACPNKRTAEAYLSAALQDVAEDDEEAPVYLVDAVSDVVEWLRRFAPVEVPSAVG